MNESQKTRVAGAFVLGFALVGASYLIANFGQPGAAPLQPQTAIETTGTTRVAIQVTDTNNNGIEDWKESITHTEPLTLTEPTATYEPPDTLTGQFGVGLYRNVLLARSSRPFGASDEQVVADSVNAVSDEAEDKLYTKDDLIVISDTPTTLRTYGNRAADIFIENDIKDVTEPTAALQRLANDKTDTAAKRDLERQAEMYRSMRDASLNTPVPEYFVPIHIAFANSFHALFNDLTAFAKVHEDPLMTLLRVKRYQDDVVGMETALEAMYVAVEESPVVFDGSESVGLFLFFKPDQ